MALESVAEQFVVESEQALAAEHLDTGKAPSSQQLFCPYLSAAATQRDTPTCDFFANVKADDGYHGQSRAA